MNISIFGLGYVGAVLCGCLAKRGHRIVGVDTDATKVDLINSGRSPIMEPGLELLIAESVRSGTLLATADHVTAVRETEMSLICVGTPSQPAGDLDLTFVRRVCEEIGGALRDKTPRHLVVVRSTMLPGSVRQTVIPAIERASGKKCGDGFGVAINPEFLRESSAIQDFHQPPKTVIGVMDERDGAAVASLYDGIIAPVIVTSLEVAEMVKYADNSFHALKITFANEFGALCKDHGIDGREVMDIFCQDQKLNISTAYLRPGFAFGGSCLPKDLRALTRCATARGVDATLLHAILASNEQQIRNAARLVLARGRKRIGVLGFAFKGGTDDLRESPVVSLVELLIGKGYEIALYDSHVSLANLIGANRRFIEQHIPHIAKLMVDSIGQLLAQAEIIIIGNQSAEFYEALRNLRPDQHVIDLTPARAGIETPATYERVCS